MRNSPDSNILCLLPLIRLPYVLAVDKAKTRKVPSSILLAQADSSSSSYAYMRRRKRRERFRLLSQIKLIPRSKRDTDERLNDVAYIDIHLGRFALVSDDS